MTQAEMIEQADKRYACQKVLADLGNPAGAYVEFIQKETFVATGQYPRDYWRLLVIIPGCPRMDVQFPAAGLPCEGCGTLYPASSLFHGVCQSCWSAYPTMSLAM